MRIITVDINGKAKVSVIKKLFLEKQCECCGRIFKTKDDNQRFHSSACYQYWKKNK